MEINHKAGNPHDSSHLRSPTKAHPPQGTLRGERTCETLDAGQLRGSGTSTVKAQRVVGCCRCA